MFKPRAGQKEVVDFVTGKMGVSAVPGSGKTQTLSYLAAQLVAQDFLADDQEILIVTLVNSAVDNFASRVAHFLRDFKLIPGIGYRVRTLHGLAYDIVREFPDLVGLDNLFSIADEKTSKDILTNSVIFLTQSHQGLIELFLDEGISFTKQKRDLSDLLEQFGSGFIQQAKNLNLSSDQIRLVLKDRISKFPLVEIGCQIYTQYQNSLINSGAVDFDDLIRYAHRILMNNRELLDRLRYRWPIILEDEAQDSSLIQEQLLRLLCGENGGWVRVGDTNQAIFETFTTANPQFLRDFINEPGVTSCNLRYSGRSTESIISLANQLIIWCNSSHPISDLRATLTKPLILPTPVNDPQQNPSDAPQEIYLYKKPLKPNDEIEIVAKSLKSWLKKNPEKTVAVLVPRNTRGSELANKLSLQNIPFIEMLNASKSTREAARLLRDIINFFVSPNSKNFFQNAIIAILKTGYLYNEFKNEFDFCIKFIQQNFPLEELFTDSDSLFSSLNEENIPTNLRNEVINAISLLTLWQKTVLLPIDQMILTISMELFNEPSDIALAHKLALMLKATQKNHPDWELPQFSNELDLIVKNRYKLYGFSSDELAFDPNNHQGEVVISTIHKAKGLEWDRVYLMSVNNYDFPSGVDGDQYISEKWFVRGRLNLMAEVISQLKALSENDMLGLSLGEGIATINARLDYAAERLRLLFVGITRAKEELVITWNTGRRSDCQEAIPLRELRTWWEERLNETSSSSL